VTLPEFGLTAFHAVVTAVEENVLSPHRLDELLPDACLCRVCERAGNELLSEILFGSGSKDLPAAPKPVRPARLRTAATAR
jgi:hypothetical protein